jgi:hypothetical protein
MSEEDFHLEGGLALDESVTVIVGHGTEGISGYRGDDLQGTRSIFLGSPFKESPDTLVSDVEQSINPLVKCEAFVLGIKPDGNSHCVSRGIAVVVHFNGGEGM